MSDQGVLNLEPYKYIHVLDTIVNITRYLIYRVITINKYRLEIGPKKFVKQDHE